MLMPLWGLGDTRAREPWRVDSPGRGVLQTAAGASPVSSAAEEEARTLEHCVVIWHFGAGRVGTPETFLFVGTAMETGRELLGEQGTLRDWPRVPEHWEGQAGGLGRRE